MCVCVCVCLCVHYARKKVIFHAQFNRFEFICIHFPDLLTYKVKRALFDLLITYRYLPIVGCMSKSISAMRDANDLVQDLNSSLRSHFLRR